MIVNIQKYKQRGFLKINHWFRLGIILITISLLISIIIFSYETQLRVREDEIDIQYKSGKLSIDEYEDKIKEIANGYKMNRDIGFWNDIFLPIGILITFYGLYLFIKETRARLGFKEVKPVEPFRYAYSNRSSSKKIEK
jgi:hypothetical protein